MSEIETVVLSLKVGDSIIETLALSIGIDIVDVKILKVQEFNTTIEVQYEKWKGY